MMWNRLSHAETTITVADKLYDAHWIDTFNYYLI